MRSPTVLLLGSALAIACLFLTPVLAKPPHPHVVFMLVDDLGMNDVGWNDQFDQIQTPRLDSLRNESITLDQYYIYRFCSPSRSTFMTGRYPWHVGQQTDMNLNPTPGIACGINLDYQFLPQVLKEKAGYETWALGKWHLGFLTDDYTPTLRGFDRYLGYYSGAEEHFSHEKIGYPPAPNTTKGYNAYDLANNTGSHVAPCLGPVGNSSGTYSSYLYGNETLRMLESHDPDVPLYVYFAWNNVHYPNEAPQHYIDMHSDIEDVNRRGLAAMLSALDDQLTDVVEGLKAAGMWDDTLLIFSTDNGGNLGGSGCNWPLRGGKYTFWQGGVKGVSFVGGGANVIPENRRGTTWDGKVHAADWYTTLTSVAGITDLNGTGPVPVDGVDVLPALLNDQDSPRTEVVLQIRSNAVGNVDEPFPEGYCESVKGRDEYQHCIPPVAHAVGPSQELKTGVIIQDQWKLIWGYPGWNKRWDGWIKPATYAAAEEVSASNHYNGTLCVEEPCLFDILSDPNEHNDVHADHPTIVADMQARIMELLKSEVTVSASGLCPTDRGSAPDPRGTAMAMATGFWQPWLN